MRVNVVYTWTSPALGGTRPVQNQEVSPNVVRQNKQQLMCHGKLRSYYTDVGKVVYTLANILKSCWNEMWRCFSTPKLIVAHFIKSATKTRWQRYGGDCSISGGLPPAPSPLQWLCSHMASLLPTPLDLLCRAFLIQYRLLSNLRSCVAMSESQRYSIVFMKKWEGNLRY